MGGGRSEGVAGKAEDGRANQVPESEPDEGKKREEKEFKNNNMNKHALVVDVCECVALDGDVDKIVQRPEKFNQLSTTSTNKQTTSKQSLEAAESEGLNECDGVVVEGERARQPSEHAR